MHYRLIVSLLLLGMPLLITAQDTSKYVRKYAYLEKDPTKDYEAGQEFFLADGIYKVWTGSTFEWGFYNEETEEKLTDANYEEILYRYLHREKRGFYRVKQDGKWGLLNDDRSVWVAIKYDELNYISRRQQHYISIEQSGKFGILNTKGAIILEAEYDEILSDGFRYKVKKGDKWGLKDGKGKELIPTCFDKIEDQDYVEYTRVKIGKKWSVFNWIKDDPCAFAQKYDDIDYFDRFFVVREAGKFGLLNLAGKEILPFEYEFMSPFFLRYLNSILVGKDKKVGVLRIDSLEAVHTEVPIEYSDVWVEENTFKIKVRLNDKIDYYFNDQTLFELEYNNVQYYPEINRVMVKKNGKWGMVSIDNEPIIPIAYSKIHVMNPKQFMAQKGTKWGLLNERGQEIIPVIYDEFDYRRKKNFFFVRKGGKWGIVSTTKGIILPPKYDDMVTLANRMFLVKQKGLWGIVAPGGRVIVPIEYVSYKHKYKEREVLLMNTDGSVKKYSLY